MLQNIPTVDRIAVGYLLKMDQFVDVIIPRGGKSLIERVGNDSRVHVIKHLMEFVILTLISQRIQKTSCEVSVNAKMRRPGICGATETILCDEEILETHLPEIIKQLRLRKCEVRGEILSL